MLHSLTELETEGVTPLTSRYSGEEVGLMPKHRKRQRRKGSSDRASFAAAIASIFASLAALILAFVPDSSPHVVTGFPSPSQVARVGSEGPQHACRDLIEGSESGPHPHGHR